MQMALNGFEIIEIFQNFKLTPVFLKGGYKDHVIL